MGGSSGGYGNLPDDYYNKMEQTARDALREGAKPQRRNVFISFCSDDVGEVNLLRGQVKNDNIPLDFSDRSLKEPFNSENSAYIKRGIREKIRQASVSLVYLTDATACSEWVDWEIRESKNLGKGVIAIYKGNSPPRNLPPALKGFGIKPIRWTVNGIMSAIDHASENR